MTADLKVVCKSEHGSDAQVIVDGQDISQYLQRIELDVRVGEPNRAKLYGLHKVHYHGPTELTFESSIVGICGTCKAELLVTQLGLDMVEEIARLQKELDETQGHMDMLQQELINVRAGKG